MPRFVDLSGEAKLVPDLVAQARERVPVVCSLTGHNVCGAELLRPDPWQWHVCISGFWQRIGEPSGMWKVSQKLNHLHGPRSRVVLLQWNDCMWSAAEWIWLTSNGKGQRINVYAYSWGGGWGAMEFARECRKRQMKVESMVLSDAVYRSPILPPWIVFNPLSLSSLYRPRIKVPDNVMNLWAFRQTSNRPSGHQFILSENTRLQQETVLTDGVEHSYMDDLPAFHDKCVEVSEMIR